MRILPDVTRKRPVQGSPSLNNSAPRSKRRLLTRPANAPISVSVRFAKSGVFRSTVLFFSLIGSICSACMISQAESDSQDRGLSAPQAEEIASPLTQVDPRKHLPTRQVLP